MCIERRDVLASDQDEIGALGLVRERDLGPDPEARRRPLPEDEVRAIVAARVAAEGRALPLEKCWPELAAFVEKHAPREST